MSRCARAALWRNAACAYSESSWPRILRLQGKRELADGEIQTACQQACPTQAIVFGDLKDPNSRVSQMQRSRRNYRVLDDVGTRPNVGYLKKVRNPLETT